MQTRSFNITRLAPGFVLSFLAAAGHSFEPAVTGTNTLVLGDQTLGSPRFGLQEWLPTQDSARAESQPSQEAIVGSAVAAQALESIVLKPKNNNPWPESGNTSVQLIDSKTFSQTTTFHEGLKINARWTLESQDRIRLKGTLINESTDSSRREVPVTLMIEFPVTTEQNQWLYTPTETLPTDSVTDLCWSFPTTAGSIGAMSRFPFGGFLQGANGYAVGFPLDQPRIARIGWDAKRNSLIVSLEVAISDLPKAFPNQVPFELVLYRFNAAGGFRQMLQDYYELNAPFVADRTDIQGNWMPFTQVDKVTRVEDFAFSYHEYHPNVSVAYNNANNIESLVYCEPVTKYIHISQSLPQTKEVLDKALLANGPLEMAVRGSGIHKNDGTLQHAWVVTPWAVGARIGTNSDFQVPRTTQNPVNAFDYSWRPYSELFRKRANDFPADWKGHGLLTDGLLGVTGRAVVLKSGESIIQALYQDVDKAEAEITLYGTPSSSVVVRLGDHEKVLTPTEISAVYSVTGNVISSATLDIRCTAGDVIIQHIASPTLKIANADFSTGVADAEKVTGLYLDSFEGWDSKDFDFRREHFQFADYPLTFEAQTGNVGQVVMFQNFEFAAEARKRLETRGDLLMANTALYQWSWSAAWFDVMGIETNWGSGAILNPPPLDELYFIRAMSYQKPYCYLQNLDFKQFRGAKVEGYFRYCLHFGFWPSFFSFNAADDPYWQDPTLYNEDRYLFLRYMEPQRLMTSAGWEPLTFASTSHEEVLIERWGGGATQDSYRSASEVFYTLLNTSKTDLTTAVDFDPELFHADSDYAVFDLIKGERLNLQDGTNQLVIDLPAGEVLAVQLIELKSDTLTKIASRQRHHFLMLADKWSRHGMIDSQNVQELTTAFESIEERAISLACHQWSAKVVANLEPVYQEESSRAFQLMSQYASLMEELQLGIPSTELQTSHAVVGEPLQVNLEGIPAGTSFVLEVSDQPTKTVTSGSVIEVALSENARVGDEVQLTLRPENPAESALYFSKSLKIRPPVEAFSLPEKIVLRKEFSQAILLRRNSTSMAEGKLIAQDPSGMLNVSLKQSDSDDASLQEFELQVQPANELPEQVQTTEVEVTFVLKGQALEKWKIPVTLLAQSSSLLRSEVAEVVTDGNYFGYSTRPLTDGLTDTRGLDWVDAAWASEESLAPHWVEFRFKQPQLLNSVTIWWALEGAVYQTSSNLLIQVRETPGSEWKTVGTHSATTPVPSTLIELPGVTASSLRLYQPSNSGYKPRPGILWLGEVEAR